MSADFAAIRREDFPSLADAIYLNSASIGPLPERTRRRLDEYGALRAAPHRMTDHDFFSELDQARALTARLLNVTAGEIALAFNTSYGLNVAARGLPLERGDVVLASDREFPANVYPWMSLAHDGVEARPIPTDNGGLTLRQVEAFADDRTRAVAASAIQFFSGRRTDLAAIGRFCRERDILFIVDAIQAIGHMKFDVQAMNIDVLATGGMKSLLALPGIGFIYVRESVAEAMRPRLIHGNATADYLHWLAYDMTLLPGAARLASGTPNVPGVFALGSSLELINELGLEHIDAHTTGLARHTIDSLTREGYQVITPIDALGPIVTFHSPYDSATTDRLIQHLAAHHIVVCKHLDAAAAPYVRVSFHCYNTAAEVDRFMEGLRGFVN